MGLGILMLKIEIFHNFHPRSPITTRDLCSGLRKGYVRPHAQADGNRRGTREEEERDRPRHLPPQGFGDRGRYGAAALQDGPREGNISQLIASYKSDKLYTQIRNMTRNKWSRIVRCFQSDVTFTKTNSSLFFEKKIAV